ncbi:unnamed protein product [Effrenium voratum]|nr:unnamed protein product [Effrenium voratum]
MLEAVETPFVLVVTGSALPTLKDLQTLRRVLESRKVLAAAGPSLGEDKVYSDFCYRLNLRHYRLGFNPEYEHSIIFDEASASSIRGSWFHEEEADAKDGPCKLCETLPPTFLAHTDVLRAVSFHPALDGEWALLDFSLRATRTPLLEVDKDSPAKPGWRHRAGRFALCPFAVMREDLPQPHLYGSSVLSKGVSDAAPWFGDDPSALGPQGTSSGRLRPERVAKIFMESNHLKDAEREKREKRER